MFVLSRRSTAKPEAEKPTWRLSFIRTIGALVGASSSIRKRINDLNNCLYRIMCQTLLVSETLNLDTRANIAGMVASLAESELDVLS